MKKRLSKANIFFKFLSEKGFFHLLSANFFVNFFAFGSHLFVALILTPTQIGQIKILQTYAALGVILAGLGFESSVLKLCSEKVELVIKNVLFKSANILTLFSTSLVFLLILILSQFNVVSKDNFVNDNFLFYMIVIIPMTFDTLHFAYLQALKKIHLLSKIQAISKLFSVILIIVLTYYYGITGYIISIILGYGITSAILFKFNHKDLKTTTSRQSLRNTIPRHWKYSGYAFLANFVSIASRYLDVLIINFFIIDRNIIGMYSFALNILIFLQIIGDTVQKITIPYFSEKSESYYDWYKAYKKYFRIYLLFGVMLLIVTNILVEPAVSLVFQSKYDEAILFIRVLAIKWFFYALVQYKGAAIFGLGKINYNFLGSVIFLVINLSIQFILLNLYGILGVAFGVTISSFIYYLLYSTTIFKRAVTSKYKITT